MNLVSLKDLKKSYPVQTAEYAVTAKIAMEPDFAWRVLYTLIRETESYQRLSQSTGLEPTSLGFRYLSQSRRPNASPRKMVTHNGGKQYAMK